MLTQFAFTLCLQTPLPEQEGPDSGSGGLLEIMSSRDIAYQLTLFDWELFSCVHEVYCKYCDVPGSPCLSKTGPVYGPFLFLNFWVVLLG